MTFPNDPITSEAAAFELLRTNAAAAGLTLPAMNGREDSFGLLAITLANILKDIPAATKVTALVNDRALNSVGAAMGSTNQNVAFGAFDYQIGANSGSTNTHKKKTAVAAGVALAAGTIAIGKWGVYLYSIDGSGTITCAAGAANFAAGYASEAAALAATPPRIAAKAPLVVVTIQTHAGTTFVGGTDALATGAGGNVAAATNYYECGVSF